MVIRIEGHLDFCPDFIYLICFVLVCLLFGISRRSSSGSDDLNGIRHLLDEEDGGVCIGLLIVGSSDQAIADDGQDPEHPEEDTETTSEHESDGSAFPGSESHERDVDAFEEWGIRKAVIEVPDVTMAAMVMVMMGVGMCCGWGKLAVGTFEVQRDEAWGTDGQDVDSTVLWKFEVLDDGEAHRLSEGVGYGKSLLAQAPAHALAGSLVVVDHVGPDEGGNGRVDVAVIVPSWGSGMAISNRSKLLSGSDYFHTKRASADLNKCGAGYKSCKNREFHE